VVRNAAPLLSITRVLAAIVASITSQKLKGEGGAVIEIGTETIVTILMVIRIGIEIGIGRNAGTERGGAGGVMELTERTVSG
jgi:hypothetical protein